jgi:hypothetical protein
LIDPLISFQGIKSQIRVIYLPDDLPPMSPDYKHLYRGQHPLVAGSPPAGLPAAGCKDKLSGMSVTEILEELPKLKAEERHILLERLNALEKDTLEETPEMLAAIDEGIRSFEQYGGVPIEEVQARLEAKWRTV